MSNTLAVVNWRSSLLIAVGLIVLFGFLIGLDGSSFGVVTLRNDAEFTSLFERLGVFVILALFVERAVQVYVTAFLEEGQREAKSNLMVAKAQVGEAQLRAARILPEGENKQALADVATATQNVSVAAKGKGQKELDTRIRTTTAGLILGTLLGLCGISVLGSLLDTGTSMPLPLRIVDIVIVGTLLSGGAEPIHQIMQAITNSLTQVKKQTEPAAPPTV